MVHVTHHLHGDVGALKEKGGGFQKEITHSQCTMLPWEMSCRYSRSISDLSLDSASQRMTLPLRVENNMQT